VQLDVVLVVAAGGERVADDAVEEGDVSAGAQRRVEIADRAGAGEAWIDADQLGVARLLGFDRPLEAAGMVLSGVAAHDQDDIGILDVDPTVGHRPAAERGGQTGHRGTVSNPCL